MKCLLGQESLEYWDHNNSNQKVALDEQIRDNIKMVSSNNSNQLRSFLGLIVLLFIRNYVSIAYYLTELLRSDSLKWHSKAQEAFDSLKKVMTEPLVLKLPAFSKPFLI